MTSPEPGGPEDAERVTFLLIVGAVLIALGNVLRRVDDNLADFPN